MPLDLYAAFVLATTVLILIPGPAVTLIVANSIAYGSRRTLMTVAGSSSAIVLQLVVTVFGMNSLMMLLAEWFEWLRWAGVAYLIYLGIQRWRARPFALKDATRLIASRRKLFWQGFVVNATNPKTLFFYAAFFPQFVDPGHAPMPQLVVLSITFFVIATLLDSGYALLAGRLRNVLTGERRARFRNRLTGTLIIGAGLGLALARRG